MTARPRSWLYVPGDDERKLLKAGQSEADALILDLEDAVAPSRKAAAREVLAGVLDQQERSEQQRWVRVDPRWWRDDLSALPADRLDGVIVAKADADVLRDVVTWSRSAGLRVAGLVETAAGLLDLRVLAGTDGLEFLMLGEADLRAELGVRPQPDGREMELHRDQLVLVSAAAQLQPPPAPTSMDFRDFDRLAETSRYFRDRGFVGRTAIHPAQAPVINEVFTPTPEEIERAADVVRRLDEAVERGSGVTVDADGRMLDEAVVRSARRVLSLRRS